MAFARRGSQQTVTSNPVAAHTLSLSLPANATAGDLLIVQISTTENSPAPGVNGVTDNQGNTYTRDVVGSHLNSSGATVGIYSCPSILASSTFTVTYSTAASAQFAMILSEYSYTGGTAQLDKTAAGGATTATNNETTSTTPVISSATELAIAAMTHDDGTETYSTTALAFSTVSSNGGSGSNSVTMIMSDRIISSAATQVCTFSTATGNTAHYDACIATYQVVAAGSGPMAMYSGLQLMGVM